jgi:transposase-like protein
MSKGQRKDLEEASQIESQRSRLDNLPPPDTRRWVPRRKAEVVAAVERGVLTADEACERYNLSLEEFETWKQLFRRHGRKGLRVTQMQKYGMRPLRRNVEAPSTSSKMTSLTGGRPGFL